MKLAFSLVVCIFLIVACVPGQPIQPSPTVTTTRRVALTNTLAPTPTSTPSRTPTAVPLPTAWENTAGVPPVGDQVSAGSCYAWAAGYYYLTHLQWRDYGLDVTDPANQCSPAFIYNLTNGGTSQRTSHGDNERADAFQVFETMGCASMADMPFSNIGLLSFPSETAFRNGMRFRTRSTGKIDVTTDEGITQLKVHLASGDLAVLGLFGYENLASIASYNNTYCVSQTSGPRSFWHDVAVVGYDDGYVTADGRGAFRIVNSLGPDWGDAGYFWMSYQAVKDPKTSSGYVLFAEDRPHYEPEFEARIGLDYPDRYNLVLRVGWGGVGNGKVANFFTFRPFSPVWEGVPYSEGRLALDLTDLLPAPAGEAVLQLQFEDRQSGKPITPSVRFLEIENRLTGRQMTTSPKMLSVPAASGTIDVIVPRELLVPVR